MVGCQVAPLAKSNVLETTYLGGFFYAKNLPKTYQISKNFPETYPIISTNYVETYNSNKVRL